MRTELLLGDSRQLIKAIPDNSISSVICDPPYALVSINKRFGRDGAAPAQYGRDGLYSRASAGFLGAKWDTGEVAFSPDFWAEVLRAAKPGAFLAAFGGTRTYHRLACAIEDAGWECRDCVTWHYGCLSEDTEILTSIGWVQYPKMTQKHHALGYNVDSQTYEWMPIQEVFVYDYCDTAYRLQSDRTDQLVSRNHRCLVKRGGGYAFQFAETLEQQACIPVLEDLPGLLQTLPLPDKRAGNTEQFLRSGLPDSIAKRKEKADTPRGTEGACSDYLSGVRQAEVSLSVGNSEGENAILFDPMQRRGSGAGVGQARLQGEGRANTRGHRLLSREDDRSQQSSLEGRRHLLQKARELRGGEVYPVSSGIPVYGPQRRLRHGAPDTGRSGDWAVPSALGSGSPQRSRPEEQQPQQPSTVSDESGTQTARTSRHTRADLVTVTPVHYEGKVWCVRVRSGAFVARRNGHVFVTGNSGYPKSKNIGGGIGTAMKPATELICIARKPLSEASVALNVLRWGTGGINVDAARIGTTVESWPQSKSYAPGQFQPGGKGQTQSTGDAPPGRWPPNVILDSFCAAEMDKQSGPRTAGGKVTGNEPSQSGTNGIYSPRGRMENTPYNDCGGASRFFPVLDYGPEDEAGWPEGVMPFLYTAKPAQSERNAGCEELPARAAMLANKTVRRCPEHDKSIPSGSTAYSCGCPISYGLDSSPVGGGDGVATATRNSHPT